MKQIFHYHWYLKRRFPSIVIALPIKMTLLKIHGNQKDYTKQQNSKAIKCSDEYNDLSGTTAVRKSSACKFIFPLTKVINVAICPRPPFNVVGNESSHKRHNQVETRRVRYPSRPTPDVALRCPTPHQRHAKRHHDDTPSANTVAPRANAFICDWTRCDVNSYISPTHLHGCCANYTIMRLNEGLIKFLAQAFWTIGFL